MAVTLAEIARQVGVDVSLVSRVLRDDASAKLSPAKRAQIHEVARATGYRPNRLGRSLRTGRTSIIGVLMPGMTNALQAVLFHGVESAAAAAGYETILCNTDDSPERFKELVSVLSEGHVDGILAATARANDESIDWLAKAGVPYLLVNRRRDQDDPLWVGPDDFQIGYLGARHLLELGHRRIAFLLSDLEVGNNIHRLAGIKAALKEFDCKPDQYWIRSDLGDLAGGKQCVRELLALPPGERPTAIFAAQALLADAVAHTAYRAGIRIPEEVSVIGYTASSDPDFTCVHVPLDEVGRLAAENLINLLNGEPRLVSPPDDRIAARLIDRGTTGPPPG